MRQTKGSETEKPNLMLLRHILTLLSFGEQKMVYLVLLSYYEHYWKDAICELGALASDLDCEYRLVVVNNGSFVIQESLGYTVVQGDNRNGEFTGWDCGLKSFDGLCEGDYFIFANDTFNHHRRWTVQSRAEFVRGFRLMRRNERVGMCGQVHRAKMRFSIDDLRLTVWVSTYLFGVSGKILKANGYRLSLSEEQLLRLVHNVTEDRVVWGDGVSGGLRTHIDQWLFPVVARRGWYRAGVASPSEKCKKVRAILNEKFISALCETMGYSFIQTRRLTIRRVVRAAITRAKIVLSSG